MYQNVEIGNGRLTICKNTDKIPEKKKYNSVLYTTFSSVSLLLLLDELGNSNQPETAEC